MIHNPNGNPTIHDIQSFVTSDYPSFITSSTPCNEPLLNSGGDCFHCISLTVPGWFLPTDQIQIIFSYIGICQGDTISGGDTLTLLANCAFDPNDKALIGPVSCGENNYIEKSKELIYKIRFQNIGNASATNVLISDKLDKNLDVSTFHIIATSHSISHFEVIPDYNYTFRFDNIMLPDSASNPQGSMGYIIFGIKAKQGLPDGTVIKNQAGIYFDFNEVVLTNTTLNTLREHPYPVADFVYKHSCTNTGLVYDFTYTGGTEDNATFLWNFGINATPGASTEINPANITFNSIGARQVTLTIERYGCIATITKDIEVVNYITGKNKDKIIICHIPPGNPGNPQTIEVSLNSLPAHLAHGDCIGECQSVSKLRILRCVEPMY